MSPVLTKPAAGGVPRLRELSLSDRVLIATPDTEEGARDATWIGRAVRGGSWRAASDLSRLRRSGCVLARPDGGSARLVYWRTDAGRERVAAIHEGRPVAAVRSMLPPSVPRPRRATGEADVVVEVSEPVAEVEVAQPRTSRGRTRIPAEDTYHGSAQYRGDDYTPDRGEMTFWAAMAYHKIQTVAELRALPPAKRYAFEVEWTARMKAACALAGEPITEDQVREARRP